MPTAFFLRICLSSHLVMRAFWNHAKRDDQLTLLRLADDTLERLGRKNDQKRIQELMKKEDEEE